MWRSIQLEGKSIKTDNHDPKTAKNGLEGQTLQKKKKQYQSVFKCPRDMMLMTSSLTLLSTHNRVTKTHRKKSHVDIKLEFYYFHKKGILAFVSKQTDQQWYSFTIDHDMKTISIDVRIRKLLNHWNSYYSQGVST